MGFTNLNEKDRENLSVLCAKALLNSFDTYLGAGKFELHKKDGEAKLFESFELAKARQDEICSYRYALGLFDPETQHTETKEDRHHRLRVAIDLEKAKREFLLFKFNIEPSSSRNADWIAIGKRLADQHYFHSPIQKTQGRPKAAEDIDLARANAFDAVKAFFQIAKGEGIAPNQIELEYAPLEPLSREVRVTDKLVLDTYLNLNEIGFYEEVIYCLSIAEEHLQLKGSKSVNSLLNSVSRGRTKRRAKKTFSLVRHHEQIFNKK